MEDNKKDDRKSVFADFFGDSPMMRILDFLLVFREFDYNKQDIAKNSNISWNTLDKLWDNLIKSSIIIPTRKVGKSQMYKLNTIDPIVAKLLEIDGLLMEKSLREVE